MKKRRKEKRKERKCLSGCSVKDEREWRLTQAAPPERGLGMGVATGKGCLGKGPDRSSRVGGVGVTWCQPYDKVRHVRREREGLGLVQESAMSLIKAGNSTGRSRVVAEGKCNVQSVLCWTSRWRRPYSAGNMDLARGSKSWSRCRPKDGGRARMRDEIVMAWAVSFSGFRFNILRFSE